jgi:hypothetical protein
MVHLARRLDLTSALSACGHESDSGSESLEPGILIGPRETANLLGLSTRQVRRLAEDLNGEEIGGGRRVYRLLTVVEYAEGRKNGRSGRGIRATPEKPVR